jgi:putative membrane protein
MFSRLSLPVVATVLIAGCNRSPAPAPEKAIPDRVVPSYQAATPASSATDHGSAMNPGTGTDGASASADTKSDTLANPESEALSDAQIARITNNVNAAEIDQAKLARSKAKDARVKAFAERMIKHHTEAKDKQAKLKLDTAESALATKLERETGTTMSELRANMGPSFDQEYMFDQVKEHQQVLDTIDRQLLPHAKNGELQAYLKEIRPTVESHLKDARDLEAKLTQQATAPRQTQQ